MKMKHFHGLYTVQVREDNQEAVFGTPEVLVFPSEAKLQIYMQRFYEEVIVDWYDRRLFRNLKTDWLFDITQIHCNLILEADA